MYTCTCFAKILSNVMTAYLGQIGLAEAGDAIICCEPYPLSTGLKWIHQGEDVYSYM